MKYSKQIEKRLKKIDKDRKKYLLVTTGHQGEHKSVLYKIAKGEFKFKLHPEDSVIFSCRTIPSPTNIENREALENELKLFGIRIFQGFVFLETENVLFIHVVNSGSGVCSCYEGFNPVNFSLFYPRSREIKHVRQRFSRM